MKIINQQKRSSVFYDEKNDTYIKTFNPKFINRLKFLFRFRNYPGKNFYFISNILKSLNLYSAEVINFSNYSVTTKNLHGINMETYIKKYPNSDIISQYITFVKKLIDNNIYCGDLSYDNFIVKDERLYAIDLEDYKKVKFFNKDKKEFFRRLKQKIDEDTFNKIINN